MNKYAHSLKSGRALYQLTACIGLVLTSCQICSSLLLNGKFFVTTLLHMYINRNVRYYKCQ